MSCCCYGKMATAHIFSRTPRQFCGRFANGDAVCHEQHLNEDIDYKMISSCAEA